MKKKEFSAAVALLTAVGAVCLHGMKSIDRKMKKEREKKSR